MSIDGGLAGKVARSRRAINKPLQGDARMFKVIGGVVVYGFALFGLGTFLSKINWEDVDGV